MHASLIRFGPIFLELVQISINQRLDFHDIWGVEWVVSHLYDFVQILLLASIIKVFESLRGLSGVGVVLAKDKLLTAPPFLNSILYLGIMRANAPNQLFLELFVGH